MPTEDYTGASNLGAIEGRRKAFRRNFAGTVLSSDYWAVAQSPGMTVAVAGGALTVGMGVAINEETIIQSIQGFTLPFRLQIHHAISQRIINQETYIELVNAAGDTYQGWMFDGATTTSAKTVHANKGASNPASPISATVTATSTTPIIREIDARLDSIDFSERTADNGAVSTIRWVKTRTTLDPEEKYFIRLRFKNLGTAPATNTNNIFESILVQDTNDVLVEIGAGRGNNHSNRSHPVSVLGTAAVSLATNTPSPAVSATVGTAPTVTRFINITNASQSAKATAGKLFGFIVLNTGAAAAYFNVYNTVAPVIGTTQPVLQVLVPAGQTLDFEPPFGVNMTTAITCAATDISAPLSAIAPGTPLVASLLWI